MKMSGSDAGVVMGIQNSQSAVQSMRVAYTGDGTAVYKPVSSPPPYQTAPPSGVAAADGSAGGGGSVTGTMFPQNLNINMGSNSEPLKRKRGRPRKYGPDGSMAHSLSPKPVTATSGALTVSVATTTSGTFSPLPMQQSVPPPVDAAAVQYGGLASSQPSLSKKVRGRPAGSSKKQQMEALGSVGIGFTPHIISVPAGEDVSSKIMSFSQHGPRAVCILSATGAISNVTLRQAATSGGSVTYEGRFDILSLSGSFLLSELGGHRSRTGGLSIALAGPDGRVLGGCVAGVLTAASPVQVIVGSFIPDSQKEPKAANHLEPPLHAPPKFTTGCGATATGASSPPSRGTLSESSGGPASPLNHSSGACNPPGMSSMPWK